MAFSQPNDYDVAQHTVVRQVSGTKHVAINKYVKTLEVIRASNFHPN